VRPCGCRRRIGVLRQAFTALLLPPLSLVLLCLIGGLLAWRGRRLGGAVAASAAVLQLFLATPLCAGLLASSLESEVRPGEIRPPGGPAPAAIIVLGGDGQRGGTALDVGPFTLERLRAAASLQRRTGLPLLVTAGPLSLGEEALGKVMARTLTDEFGIEVRWVEARATDTHENALFSAAMLREAGIGSAYVVTHGWHMPRAQAAFARLGFATAAAPASLSQPPTGAAAEWVPRPDHLADSWFALREWAGRLVYAVRD
jgi:uncharacterized SAM-binding protein YcdF (DUF218 family)